jgi:hypothetical protein
MGELGHNAVAENERAIKQLPPYFIFYFFFFFLSLDFPHNA